MGFDLFGNCYPRQAELQLALRNIFCELSFGEIGRADSGLLGLPRAARHHINTLSDAMKELPPNSAAMLLWKEIAPQLAALSGVLQKQMQELPREARRPSLTERRVQRVLRGRLHQFLRMADDKHTGPTGLATFIVSLLKDSWPSIPAGLLLDPAEYFDHDSRRGLIRTHLGRQRRKDSKPARALWNILFAILHREELRTPLLRLARHHAQTRNGWTKLRSNLTKVFKFIVREPSKQAQVTSLMLADWPKSRGKTNASLASAYNESLRLVSKAEFDAKAEGKSSVEVMMRRSGKKLRSEHGLV